MKYFLILFFTCSFLFVNNSMAQSTPQDTSLRLIEKHDGTKYIAKIISDDGRELLLQTEALGKLYLPKSEVKRISKIEDVGEIKDGEFREESPFTTRYAFTNNALPIKKNSHYAMVNLYGPEVHFAVNDRLNIGIMTTWIGSPFVAVGKYTIPTSNKKINLSIASMIGSSGYLQSFRGFGGLHWGTITYGDRNNNISFSGGFGYFNPGTPNYDWSSSQPGSSVTYGTTSQNVLGEYTTDQGQMDIYNDYQYDQATGTSVVVSYEYFNYNRPDVPFETIRNTQKAPIFSIAGIFKLTNRASLFFDSMFGLGMGDFTTTNIYGGMEIIRDGNGNVIGVDSRPYVYSVVKSRPFALYFMPGMRFQKYESRAFQIAVAGVSVWENGDSFTFPLPLISWFIKF